MWFDSHCHLYDVEEHQPLSDVLERVRADEVVGVVVPGVDVASSWRAIELAANEGVWAAAAFHPTGVKGWDDAWAEPIDELLADERVVAVGESGIDLYWDKSFVDDQMRAFDAHIDLAKKHDKALVIHTRDSINEALDALERRRPPTKLIFHCWSGDGDQLARALALGSFISFAGNVSFKRAENLREVAAAVPDDRLLIETDAPYLTPEPHRGKKNEPAFVRFVGDAVAAARGVEPAEVAQLTTMNARRIFGLD